MLVIIRPWNYRRFETKNHSHCIDTLCQDGAGSVLPFHYPIMAANDSFLNDCNQLPLRLPKMQDQIMLMLHWHLFSWWGREHITIISAHKAGQYFNCVIPQPTQFVMTWLTRPEIVNALLILILPQAVQHNPTIRLGIWYHSQCCCSLSIVFMYILLDQYIVLWEYLEIYSFKYTLKYPLMVDNNTQKIPIPFDHGSLSLELSRNILLSSAYRMSTAVPYSR